MKQTAFSLPFMMQDLAALLSNATALHTLLCIFYYKTPALPALVLWCALLFVLYTVLCFLIRFAVSPRFFSAGVPLVLGIQAAALVHWNYAPDKAVTWALLLLIWFIPASRACTLHVQPATPEQRMLDFELTLPVLILTVLLQTNGSFPPALTAVPLISMLAALLALVLQRSNGHNTRFSAAEPFLLMLLPSGLIGLAALFATFLAGPLSSVVDSIWQILLLFLLTILRSVDHFLVWFFSLFPATQPVAMKFKEAELEVPPAIENSSVLQINPTFPILLLMLLAGIVLLLYLLQKSSKKTNVRNIQRQSIAHHPFSAFHRKLRAIRQYILLQLACITGRNTPEGLYVYLRNLLRRNRCQVLPSQSCRQMLLDNTSRFPGCEEDLLQLADWLDACYYSEQTPQIDSSQIIVMRKKLTGSFQK